VATSSERPARDAGIRPASPGVRVRTDPAERFAFVPDRAFRVPGKGWRFGLDDPGRAGGRLSRAART
jgi:hypothetical protein